MGEEGVVLLVLGRRGLESKLRCALFERVWFWIEP